MLSDREFFWPGELLNKELFETVCQVDQIETLIDFSQLYGHTIAQLVLDRILGLALL